ncbi:MAG: xanthine dehydrogenase family protein molybdopterin-binding subunit [Verrucomicrobiota bacterium]
METTVIGKPLNRYEGRAKVTGRARYAADHNSTHVAYAYPLGSTISSGTIASIDSSAAENAPGVLLVLHHGNIGKLHPVKENMEAGIKAAEERPPFHDRTISYAGQFVAVVIAKTFEQARWAARLVQVEYRETKASFTLDAGIAENRAKAQDDEKKSRGKPDEAFAKAAVQIDQTYHTPVEVHNAMELHSTVAEWQADRLTLEDSTQWVVGQAKTIATMLGIPSDHVTVKSAYIGSGFGSKLFLWPHAVVAAVAARQLKRPVKFVLPRAFQFTNAGHRPVIRQRIRLGASREGKLLALLQDTHSHTSLVTDYVESCGESNASLYSVANLSNTHHLVPLNVSTPTSMRGPGSCPGLFALESALDELALQLKLDPLELRLRNIPATDEDKQLPWSASHFETCLRQAADRFGWLKRQPGIGAMRDGSQIIGWGIASATWPAMRRACSARIELKADGTAKAECATQDIGTGTYTVIASVVAELTGLPPEKVVVAIGNSTLPPGPISGGSMATATFVPAIAEATRKALEQLPGFKPTGPNALAAALRTAGREQVIGETETKPGEEAKKFSFRCFGAHCAEIRWDPGISKLRVSRIVSVIDAGRIMNAKTARNQIDGALVMGLGMALMEEGVRDPRTGRVVNDNLADYHMLVHADMPDIDVKFLDVPDPHIGDFGAKGLGEIGITGIAAAIANAVHHATGKRIRDLPISIEKLLA